MTTVDTPFGAAADAEPYIWSTGERCRFYLLNKDMTGRPSQLGTVVEDSGLLTVTVADADGQHHVIAPGHLWKDGQTTVIANGRWTWVRGVA